jgi:hypothetical protein
MKNETDENIHLFRFFVVNFQKPNILSKNSLLVLIFQVLIFQGTKFLQGRFLEVLYC